MLHAHSVEEIDSLVRRVVSASLALAADANVPGGVRRACAELMQDLAHRVGPDEAVCADVMRAAQLLVVDHRAVGSLLGAAVVVAPDEGRLAVPVRRLCERAFEQGHAETLAVGLNWLARVAKDERDGDVPAEWFDAVARVTPRRLPYLLQSWVGRFGADHAGLRALVRAHERCLLARFLSTEVVRTVHASQPTASGWLALADDADDGDTLKLSFGDHREEALSTLRGALDRAGDDAVRVRLSYWLLELLAQ